MTREEAIEAIKCNWPDSRYTILREALDMAISALRQQETVANRNEPLTLDELRKMDGEPVWLVNQNGGRWVIMSGAYLWDSRKNADYGKTWLAYRQKPEEDDHDERKENENVRR